MACSVVRRLERCERIKKLGADQHEYGEAQHYHVIKYKIEIKESYTASQINLTGSDYEELKAEISPQAPAAACGNSSSPSPLRRIRLPSHGDSKAPASSMTSPPCSHHEQSQQINLIHAAQDDLAMRLRRFLDHDEDNIASSCLLQLPWKPRRTILQEHNIYPDTSSGTTSFTLHPPVVAQKREDGNSAASPSDLRVELSCPDEEKEETNCEPISASVQELQQTIEGREDESRATTKAQELKLSSAEDGRGEARSAQKLLQKEGTEEKKYAGEEAGEEVKKMECECCGIEEEYTGGYEKRVRGRLRGHWLCGLCEAAVGEERKRMEGAGSVQAALEAHMQPCRRFSHQARSKASPPPALPHAVGRLLCRHLSMLSPRRPSSSSSSPLSRSSSLPN